MPNWLKWITHKKVWVRHENGTRRCVCGHPQNEHIRGRYCGNLWCNCYEARYQFHWRKR